MLLRVGEAVWLRAHQAVNFTNCNFIHNRTNWGQTISFENVDFNYPVSFTKCFFKENGDYVIWYIGDNSALNDALFQFTDCIFQENGLPVFYPYFFGTAKIRVAFENCIFNSNKRVTGSESIVISIVTNSIKGDVFIANCLFVKNDGAEVVVWPSTSTVQISNSILIDSVNDIDHRVLGGTAVYNVSNSLFRLPNCTLLGGFNTPVFCDTTNLFAIDPLFANTAESDFHLQICSPAINAGANSILDSLGITTDLDDKPRIRNAIVDWGRTKPVFRSTPVLRRSRFVQKAPASWNSARISVRLLILCGTMAIPPGTISADLRQERTFSLRPGLIMFWCRIPWSFTNPRLYKLPFRP